jgi:lipopolysaccharide biosynthesis glycosyltransferase
LNINKSKPINHFIIGKIKNHALRSKLKQDNKQKLKEAREKKEAKKQKKKKKTEGGEKLKRRKKKKGWKSIQLCKLFNSSSIIPP